MMYEVEGQMSIFDVDGWFGKMSQEPSRQTPARTSEQFSKKSRGSTIRLPLFLDLRTENGRMPDASWQMGGALLGEYTMHSFGEQPNTLMEECGFEALPNGVDVSRLSQILVDNALPKYSLSATAAKGILKRGEKKGKEIPKVLKEALEHQVTR